MEFQDLPQPGEGHINQIPGRPRYWDPLGPPSHVHLPSAEPEPISSTNAHPDSADYYFFYDHDKVAQYKKPYFEKYSNMMPSTRIGPSNSIPISESELVIAQRVQLLILVALGSLGLSVVLG